MLRPDQEETAIISIREKFNFLWHNTTPTSGKSLKEFVQDIYKWAEEYNKINGLRPAFIAKNDPQNAANAMQTRLSTHVSPAMVYAICKFFDISEATWAIDNRLGFIAGAKRELLTKDKFRNQKAAISVWAEASIGRDVDLKMHRLNAMSLGRKEKVLNIDTFKTGEFVRLTLTIDFPARICLIAINPKKGLKLLAPSEFIPDPELPAGTCVLPTHEPSPDHPAAFAVEGRIGTHYLWVLAVSTDVDIELPESDDTGEVRSLTVAEFEKLGVLLHDIDQEKFGITVHAFQVSA